MNRDSSADFAGAQQDPEPREFEDDESECLSRANQDLP